MSSHRDRLNIDIKKISIDDVRDIIKSYDDLNEQLEYSFPNHIKTQVKNTYLGEKSLPNILNCQIDFAKKIQNSSIDLDKNEKIESSIVYKNDVVITPRVIPYKKIIDLQFVEGEGTNL